MNTNARKRTVIGDSRRSSREFGLGFFRINPGNLEFVYKFARSEISIRAGAIASGIASVVVAFCSVNCAYGQGIVQTWSHGTGAYFGSAVAGVGDIDGDGLADVAISDLSDGGLSGAVWTYSGSDAHELRHFFGAPLEEFGAAMRNAGDVDQDGYDDILIGAPGVSGSGLPGRAAIFSAKNGKLLFSWVGANASSKFGQVVDSCGDVDLDGCPDVVVGSPWDLSNSPNNGLARVYSGKSGMLLRSFGTMEFATSSEAADNVAGLGDTDGDGVPDLALTVSGTIPTNPFSYRHVQVVSGGSGSLLHILVGDLPSIYFGDSGLCSVGDVDNDGRRDIGVGDVNYSTLPGNKPGVAWVFAGSTGSVIHKVVGLFPDALGTNATNFGAGIRGLGDWNGDGIDDFAVSAPSEIHPAVGLSPTGAIHIFSGGNVNVLKTILGPAAAYIGSRFDLAGDVNGDGAPDIVAGGSGVAPYAGPGAAVYVFTTVCGSSHAIGSGCPNASSIIPKLSVQPGCVAPGSTITLSIDLGGFSNGVTLLAISSGTGSHPLGMGCTLYSGTFPTFFPLVIPFYGVGSVTGRIPIVPVVLGSSDMTTQVFAPAPGTALGYSASNGLFLDVN